MIGYFGGDAEVEIDWLNETLHINEKEQQIAKFHFRRAINARDHYGLPFKDASFPGFVVIILSAIR